MLYGLGDLPAEQAALLEEKRAKILQQIKDLIAYQAFANREYQRTRFGGKSPDQFNAFISEQQANQVLLQAQADELAVQIQKLNDTSAADAQKTAATAAAKAAFISPAQAAANAQAEADRFSEQMRLLGGPRNDYGAESAARTSFYSEYAQPMDAGLGDDIWGAVTAAVQKKGLEALKGISVKGAPTVSLPAAVSQAAKAVQLPSWLRGISVSAPNLAKLPAAIQAELRRQRQAAAAAGSSAELAQPGAPVTLSPSVSWVGLLLVAGTIAVAVKLAQEAD